jgi:hypothetical protein
MSFRPLLIAVPAALALAAATPGFAQTAAQKAQIDAAKAAGTVGEQADGYVGFRTPSSDASLNAAVSTTNAARRAAYASSAAQAGTTTEVAAARMFELTLFARIPAGQWYRNASGQWVQK